MPKYRVYGVMTVTKYFGEIEADSQDEAVEIAENSDDNHASLCHQCSQEIALDDYSFQRFECEKVEE